MKTKNETTRLYPCEHCEAPFDAKEEECPECLEPRLFTDSELYENAAQGGD